MELIRRYSVFLFLAVVLNACSNAGASQAEEKHLAEVRLGNEVLYIDAVNNDFMKIEDGGETVFRSFKMGFLLKPMIEKEAQMEFEKYFQYRMQNDWKLMIKNDSVSPVFLHPVTKLNGARREAILVFELPKQEEPERLVFDDSYAGWGRQTFSLIPISKGNTK